MSQEHGFKLPKFLYSKVKRLHGIFVVTGFKNRRNINQSLSSYTLVETPQWWLQCSGDLSGRPQLLFNDSAFQLGKNESSVNTFQEVCISQSQDVRSQAEVGMEWLFRGYIEPQMDCNQALDLQYSNLYTWLWISQVKHLCRQNLGQFLEIKLLSRPFIHIQPFPFLECCVLGLQTLFPAQISPSTII